MHSKERAVRRLARIVASALIQAMAERDMSFEDVDRRLERRRGWTRRYIYRLADGRPQKGLRVLGEVSWALDAEINFRITPMESESARGTDIEADAGASNEPGSGGTRDGEEGAGAGRTDAGPSLSSETRPAASGYDDESAG